MQSAQTTAFPLQRLPHLWTIAILGSNHDAGVLTANSNLNVLAVLRTGYRVLVCAGATLKAAVADGTLIGAVTQAPVDQGNLAIHALFDYCEGNEVSDTLQTATGIPSWKKQTSLRTFTTNPYRLQR